MTEVIGTGNSNTTDRPASPLTQEEYEAILILGMAGEMNLSITTKIINQACWEARRGYR